MLKSPKSSQKTHTKDTEHKNHNKMTQASQTRDNQTVGQIETLELGTHTVTVRADDAVHKPAECVYVCVCPPMYEHNARRQLL